MRSATIRLLGPGIRVDNLGRLSLSRDTVMILRIPTTPPLPIADYRGWRAYGRLWLPSPASHGRSGAMFAPFNETDVLAEQNAPHRGVQREIVIFRTILRRFPPLSAFHRDRSPYHDADGGIMGRGSKKTCNVAIRPSRTVSHCAIGTVTAGVATTIS